MKENILNLVKTLESELYYKWLKNTESCQNWGGRKAVRIEQYGKPTRHLGLVVLALLLTVCDSRGGLVLTFHFYEMRNCTR